MFGLLRKLIQYWYLQYELITCSYIFEPWEKFLLDSIVIIIVILVSYSSYMYLPSYLYSLWEKVELFLHKD